MHIHAYTPHGMYSLTELIYIPRRAMSIPVFTAREFSKCISLSLVNHSKF